MILHSESRLGEAERHYQAALEVDTSLVEAKAGLGALWCRATRHNEGIALLEKVVGVDPDRINARFNLAVAYHKIGDLRQVDRAPRGGPEAESHLSRARDAGWRRPASAEGLSCSPAKNWRRPSSSSRPPSSW